MNVKAPARFEDGLGYLVHHLMYAFRQKLACRCSEQGYNLTSDECGVLMLLMQGDARGSGLTHGQMAETLAKDKAAITRLVNSLHQQGLVDRNADARDRRIMRVRLTDKGREAAVRLRSIIEQLHRQVFVGIEQDEFDACRDVLGRVLTNISAMQTDEPASRKPQG